MKNRIKELRERSDLSQAKLAELVGTTQQQIGRLENSKRRLSDFWLAKLAPALDCLPLEIFEEQDILQIPILGSVGAGEQVIPLDDMPITSLLREHDYEEMNCEFVEAPPGGAGRNMVALRVVGDSMEPWVGDGDIVYYNGIIKSGFNEYIGKKVIAKLDDDRLFVKILRRGFDYGTYNLQSINSPKVIEGIKIEWCAKVMFTKPA